MSRFIIKFLMISISLLLTTCSSHVNDSTIISIDSKSSQSTPIDNSGYLIATNQPFLNIGQSDSSQLDIMNAGEKNVNITNISSSSNIDLISSSSNECNIYTDYTPSNSCSVSFSIPNQQNGNGNIVIDYTSNGQNYTLTTDISWYMSGGAPLVGISVANPILVASGTVSDSLVTVYNLSPYNLTNISLLPITNNTDSSNTLSYSNNMCSSLYGLNSTCTFKISIQAGSSIGSQNSAMIGLTGSSSQGTYTRYNKINYQVSAPPITFTYESSIQRGQYARINFSLNSPIPESQVISVTNSSLLNTAGIFVFASQLSSTSTSLSTCTLNNSNTTCTLYIQASSQSVPNTYSINLLNTGSISFSNNISIVVNQNTAAVMYKYGNTARVQQTGIKPSSTLSNFYPMVDSNYLTGYPWVFNYNGATSPSFRFYDDGYCIHDYLTGLMWSKTTYYGKFESVVKVINTVPICGHTDWRLPTINELLTLWDYSYLNYQVNTTTDNMFLKYFRDYLGISIANTNSRYFGSSTICSSSISTYSANFNNQHIMVCNSNTMNQNFIYVTKELTVSSIPNKVMDTNQTLTAPIAVSPTSYYNGAKPSNVGAPVALPADRFVADTESCTYDKATGLTWTKTPYVEMSFNQSQAFARNLDLCGYKDWRLPNILEMYSLAQFQSLQQTESSLYGYINFPNLPKCYYTNFTYSASYTGEGYFNSYLSVSVTNSAGPSNNGLSTGFGKVNSTYPNCMSEYVRGGNFP